MPGFSYTVHARPEVVHVAIGPLREAAPPGPFKTGCLVIEDAVLARHGAALRALAARVIADPAEPVVLGGGEGVKSIAAAEALWDALARRGVDRSGVLVAAGGGALLDLCGFCAGTHLRGVALVVVPTTLLAQADACLGGKSAMNAGGAKNQVGLIRQPAAVLVDPDLLATLQDEEFLSGCGELVKTGLLEGGAAFERLVSDAPDVLRRSPVPLRRAIEAALRFKAGVVERDPFDLGERMLLNAGHTAGHVLEASAQSRGAALPHGIAVAAGLRVEAGVFPDCDVASIERACAAFGLQVRAPGPVAAEDARVLLARDKKAGGGVVRIPAILRPGVVVLRDVPREDVVRALASG